MRKSFKGVIVAAGLAILLGGCALNAVRLQRADTMVAASREAADQTRQLMTQTQIANRELLIDLIATDPNCNPRDMRMIGGDRRLPPQRICRYDGDRLSASDSDWTFNRIGNKDFEPTLVVIKGLSGYLDLVEAVLNRDKLDIAADLTAARDDMQALYDAAVALGGNDSPFPALTTGQETAISNTLGLLSTILDERGRVIDLRRIETRTNQILFSRAVVGLAAANEQWLKRLKGQTEGRIRELRLRLQQLQKASPDQRRPVAEALVTQVDLVDKIPAMSEALKKITTAMATSHEKYIDLLFNDHAELSDEERAFMIKENHDRVMKAIKAFTSLITAF
jgi:hypothetical protein